MKFAIYKEDGTPVELVHKIENGKYIVAHKSGAKIIDTKFLEPIKVGDKNGK